MQTSEREIRRPPRPEAPPPWRSRRWLEAASAGAVAMIAVVVAIAVAGGSSDEPSDEESAVVVSPGTTIPADMTGSSGTVLPDVAADGSNMGEAFEIAFNAHDPELLSTLFSDDAEVRMSHPVISSLDVLVTSVGEVDPVLGTQVDMGECSGSAGRVQCNAVSVTYDWLKPLVQSPVPLKMTFTVEDGLITKLRGELVWAVREAGQVSEAGLVMAAFKAWTFENYPEEAERIWIADEVRQPSYMETAEAAELAMRLGQEYVDSLQ